MAAISYGKAHVFGIGKIGNFVGFPSGKVRVRMRHDEFVRVFIKTASGIECFRVREDESGNWILSYKVGKNFRS